MPDGFLDDVTIPVTCKCGRKHNETMARLKRNNKVVCTCGATTVVDISGATGAFDSVNKAVDNLSRTIDRLNKRKL